MGGETKHETGHGKITCNYLLRSGKTCGGRSWMKTERCYIHRNAKKRIPCKVCGIPTSSKPGLCRNHAGSYYVIQYVKRLREKAKG